MVGSCRLTEQKPSDVNLAGRAANKKRTQTNNQSFLSSFRRSLFALFYFTFIVILTPHTEQDNGKNAWVCGAVRCCVCAWASDWNATELKMTFFHPAKKSIFKWILLHPNSAWFGTATTAIRVLISPMNATNNRKLILLRRKLCLITFCCAVGFRDAILLEDFAKKKNEKKNRNRSSRLLSPFIIIVFMCARITTSAMSFRV